MLACRGDAETKEADMDYGLWSKPGVPHQGWSCIDVEDLGEPAATCEMCERMTIRYVHTMTHPQWKGELAVGCVCAGNMEGDIAAAKGREKALAKKVRWAGSRAWKPVTGKPITYCYPKGTDLFVKVERAGREPQPWSLTVLDYKGTQIHRSWWPSELAAKLRAYEGLLRLKK